MYTGFLLVSEITLACFGRDVLELAVKFDNQLAEAYTNLGVALQVCSHTLVCPRF